MRAVAQTGVWQNWERDFPKKFGRLKSPDKTVLDRRKDGPMGGRGGQQDAARLTYGSRKMKRA